LAEHFSKKLSSAGAKAKQGTNKRQERNLAERRFVVELEFTTCKTKNLGDDPRENCWASSIAQLGISLDLELEAPLSFKA
jgi:hypothetical protein